MEKNIFDWVIHTVYVAARENPADGSVAEVI